MQTSLHGGLACVFLRHGNSAGAVGIVHANVIQNYGTAGDQSPCGGGRIGGGRRIYIFRIQVLFWHGHILTRAGRDHIFEIKCNQKKSC